MFLDELLPELRGEVRHYLEWHDRRALALTCRVFANEDVLRLPPFLASLWTKSLQWIAACLAHLDVYNRNLSKRILAHYCQAIMECEIMTINGAAPWACTNVFNPRPDKNAWLMLGWAGIGIMLSYYWIPMKRESLSSGRWMLAAADSEPVPWYDPWNVIQHGPRRQSKRLYHTLYGLTKDPLWADLMTQLRAL